ncbi:type II toxin-antitoxin system RelB/DinJ family antitoxin [Pseudomonas putida]|uniref:Type II toxin-antitoxin system RelB/DinJ family antitoxin n=1 Tax=Pseudomonas putida TaxID=303 RepID=A0A7Y7ZH00_PSEPU|nr:type II toxin-antitoxin system RelB/DinJ family antitoxin [Pseudomonas putida]NWC84283.1 type II toxin-antitoxin system RelB/DinJ family antitoxin [Pseudomonas putida]
MACINIRIDDELKARAYKELKRLGVTLSELIHQVLQYVAEQGKLPLGPAQVADEDEDLIATVNEPFASPLRVKVQLDRIWLGAIVHG